MKTVARLVLFDDGCRRGLRATGLQVKGDGMTFDMETTPARQIYNLLIGLVAPRPIAWVTSMDEQGRLNAAPFSSYNYLCTDPPIVGMGVMDKAGNVGVPKDTAWNIKRTGEYVINVVTEDLLEKMNVCATDFPAGVNELEMAGLTTTASSMVKVPRIAEAHAALECTEFASIAVGNKSRIFWARLWRCMSRTNLWICRLRGMGRISRPKNFMRSAG
jgi:flavin reductase (DIM6/NTAB) family NADH-FMN oxidoreductase RutF